VGVSLERFSALVGGIHDAALDASLWSNILKDLVTTFDGGCGALLVNTGQSRHAVHVSIGQDHASVASYNAYYGRIDPFASAIERMSEGSVVRGWDIVTPGEQFRSEFFNDWAAPNGIGDCVFANLVRDGDNIGWLGIGAAFRSEPFADPDKMRLMHLLVPHLQQALRVQSSLGDIGLRQHGMLRALDCLAHGLVLLDAGGAVVFANRAAERMAAAGDGMALGRTGFRAASQDDNAVLLRLIGDAIGRRAGGPSAGGSLALTRPSGRPPFVIHVMPAETGGDDLSAVRALAVIIDIERQPRELAPMLRRIYGLTQGEATVACEVARGEGLQPVADKMSITLSTVRVHLQRAFEKTHTHRQAELARLLLTIEAAIEPPSGHL
jgi:DNA-binding CsgD family transcriptional regulator/PAS domain-containing protein